MRRRLKRNKVVITTQLTNQNKYQQQQKNQQKNQQKQQQKNQQQKQQQNQYTQQNNIPQITNLLSSNSTTNQFSTNQDQNKQDKAKLMSIQTRNIGNNKISKTCAKRQQNFNKDYYISVTHYERQLIQQSQNDRFQQTEYQQSFSKSFSKQLFKTFIQFTQQNKQTITLTFQVIKKQFKISQKYYKPQSTLTQKAIIKKYYSYSVDVLQQSCFQKLCNTITDYSYIQRRQFGGGKKGMHWNRSNNMKSLVNKNKNGRSFGGPQRTIKRFFQHLYEYFISQLKQLENKQFQYLLKFSEYIQITKDKKFDLNRKNSSNNKERWPIYVGGLKNICKRFFMRILRLFLLNEEYISTKIKICSKQRIIKQLESKRRQLQIKNRKQAQTQDDQSLRVISKKYDLSLIQKQATRKQNSQMMIRTNHLIDQLLLKQKNCFLTEQSMRQFLQLKVHQKVFSDYDQKNPTEILPNQTKIVKRVIKGQIRINKKNNKEYKQKQIQIYNFLLNQVFKPTKDNNDNKDQDNTNIAYNQFIQNKKVKIRDKSFAWIFSDGKYIIQVPYQQITLDQDIKFIEQFTDLITNKVPQKAPHQFQTYYFGIKNTGIKQQINLTKVASQQFFKHKTLSFTDKSQYFLYFNKKFGFYGVDAINNFKARIYKKKGKIQYINVLNQKQQCQRYSNQICKAISNSLTKNSLNQNKPTYFFIKTLPYQTNSNKLQQVSNEQIEKFSIQDKQQKRRKYKRKNLSILTWNLQRQDENVKISRKKRFDTIIQGIKSSNADILCLQQIHDIKKHLYQILCQQNQLYYMPHYDTIGQYQTLILTKFPAKFFTMKIQPNLNHYQSRKQSKHTIACCEFEIQTYQPPQKIYDNQQQQKWQIQQWKKIQQQQKDKKEEEKKQILQTRRRSKFQRNIIWNYRGDSSKSPQKRNMRQKPQDKITKTVLIMSIHLKCTQNKTRQDFTRSIQNRSLQLQDLQKFFLMNEQNQQFNVNANGSKGQKKKYDIIILAGDWNIDDEPIQCSKRYKSQSLGHNKQNLNDNLKKLGYYDLQAQLHPQTKKELKTHLYKGIRELDGFKIGGSRLDRILVRTHPSTLINQIIGGLSQLSLLGDYSVKQNQNVNDVNQDAVTKSASDHFGLYMEILFKI